MGGERKKWLFRYLKIPLTERALVSLLVRISEAPTVIQTTLPGKARDCLKAYKKITFDKTFHLSPISTVSIFFQRATKFPSSSDPIFRAAVSVAPIYRIRSGAETSGSGQVYDLKATQGRRWPAGVVRQATYNSCKM